MLKTDDYRTYRYPMTQTLKALSGTSGQSYQTVESYLRKTDVELGSAITPTSGLLECNRQFGTANSGVVTDLSEFN